MRAGVLRHSLTLQMKSVSRDQYGGEVTSWITFDTVFGEATPLSGREAQVIRMADADITTKFTIRYLSGVTPEMRVVWDSVPYNIKQVLNVSGRYREMELLGFAEVPV